MTAGVAVHSTLVATTEQLARGRGYSGEEGTPWRVRQAHMPRGRRTGDNEHHGPRLGLGTFARVQQGGASKWSLTVFPCSGGAQLAIDTTLVSALRSDGSARRHAADIDGVALEEARRRKARTYPKLVGPHRRARLVVLAVEVGGRWSDETRRFLSQLARAKSRGETSLMRKRAEQAWRLRWGSILACTVARAVATSMLELPGVRGADGCTPSAADVEQEFQFAGLTG